MPRCRLSLREDRVSIKDMLSHSQEAMHLLGAVSREDLRNNRVLQLALTRLVEIVGEAANRVSLEMQQDNPQIPWDQITGMRNRLIHGYDVIDLDLLWDTIKEDLPPLELALAGILESLE